MPLLFLQMGSFSRFKAIKLLFVVVAILLLNGCVVQRLMQFKQQLKHAVSAIDFSQPGILRFHHPILFLEDIQLMTGIRPTRVEGAPGGVRIYSPRSAGVLINVPIIIKEKNAWSLSITQMFFIMRFQRPLLLNHWGYWVMRRYPNLVNGRSVPQIKPLPTFHRNKHYLMF